MDLFLKYPVWQSYAYHLVQWLVICVSAYVSLFSSFGIFDFFFQSWILLYLIGDVVLNSSSS